MKKILFILLIAGLGLASVAKADNDLKKRKPYSYKPADGEKCFDENTHIINLGVGFGSGSYYNFAKVGNYSYVRTPVFSVSYEQAYKKKLGPGYLGIGAFFGFQTATYKYTYSDYYYNNYGTYYYQHHWNYMSIAARGAYHWDVLNSKRAEVYAGMLIGLRIQTYSYTSDDPDPNINNANRLSQGSVYPAFSVFAGARWYFVPRVGLYAEVGYGISYATGGFSFKF
ncbi:MAG: hypothetical protein ACXVP0_11390 [Bacteroidia bacterium]